MSSLTNGSSGKEFEMKLAETLLQIKRPTFFYSTHPRRSRGGKGCFRFCGCAIDLQSLWVGPDRVLAIFDRKVPRSDRSCCSRPFCRVKRTPRKPVGFTPIASNSKLIHLKNAAVDAGLRFKFWIGVIPARRGRFLRRRNSMQTWFQNKPLTWNTMLESVITQR